ncbi:beta-ketoacyl synthase N-terminal-like domain-containing protein [Streptomyces sp. GMR22]|uniref:beta-ketoacyl synthase N-terminal-like domain-containing protein n=1 Tax=Streptomyces sp. GMR22 TaxID=2759524 RepID=UPI0015FA5081|nr:beta-ketoacyl synthase N-terminal-like domain-containing protein [Streptomyces sp. GMR22]MBA6436585.1 hypothetical protein [Streptomyces sp. GMR22]
MNSTQKFAIAGINCRLPGARDVGKYWSNLKAGTESITTWSLEELITPREAEVRDPQHRLFLESVHTALEDVGYDPFPSRSTWRTTR